jgi:uncharacterized membrane protein
MIIVAKIIKAPFFMLQWSQANIGGAASAPIVAAAFSPFSLRRVYWLFWLCVELTEPMLVVYYTPNISN